MKVLHITPYYKPAWKLGGPVPSISRQCEWLSRLGITVEVFTTDVAGASERLAVPLGKPQDVDGVKVTYLKSRGYWRYFFAPELLSLLKQRIDGFNIVHLQGSFTFFQIAWALSGLRFQIPFIVSPRGSFMPNALNRGFLKWAKKSVFMRLIESPVIGSSSAVHCVTDMEQEAVVRRFPSARTFVIPTGIRVSQFDELPTRGLLRKKLKLRDDDFIFLYLGRLHPHKGIDLSIRALAQAIKNGLNAELVLAGQAEFGSNGEWVNLAKQLGIAQHTHFIGHVSGMERLQCFADADAFLLNSYSENFGMSVVEAILTGLPVVVSDQAGTSDWVRKNHAGLVVPQDVSRISDALIDIVSDYTRHKKMILPAQQKARQEFDYRSVAASMLNQYESILRTGFPSSNMR